MHKHTENNALGRVLGARMDVFQPHPWQRLTLAAIIGGGIALSAILAVHFSNTQIEARRHQLMVEATGFAADLEQYLHGREMIAKTVGSVFEAPDLSSPHPLGSIGKKVLTLTPEIGVIGWIPQVDPSRIQEVLTAFSAAGRPPRLYGPNFETLDVTDTHRVLYPVVDVEPKSDDHQAGLGMDISLSPLRKAAFEQARDEQRVIATRPRDFFSLSIRQAIFSLALYSTNAASSAASRSYFTSIGC